MIQFNIKPSPRIVQQISFIERFTGAWQRITLSPAIASQELNNQALMKGSSSILFLDTTVTTGFHDHQINNNFAPYQALLLAQNYEVKLSLLGLERLFEIVTCPDTEQQKLLTKTEFSAEINKKLFRSSSTCFYAPPDSHQNNYEIVFQTVSSFLIEQRLTELIQWTIHELQQEIHHPLIIIGTFHLLFLQIHPYHTANHRLSWVIIYQMLCKQSFNFVRYSHFTPYVLANLKGYLSALRQAEKTALSSWSTINIWLEFFFEALSQSCQSLELKINQNSKSLRLTTVQKRIIEVIRSNGAASREKIVNDTNINRSTVKYNLSVLTENGYLRRDGGGRSTSYTLI